MNSLDKMEDYDRMKRERDDAIAQVVVMRDALDELEGYARNFSVSGVYLSEEIEGCRLLDRAVDAATITPSAALREIEARVLDEATNVVTSASSMSDVVYKFYAMAAAKRKGEE